MRYATPPALFFDQSMAAVPGDTPFVPEGPMALPGRYTVKLIVDGVPYTQRMLLKQDPRLDDSPGAMEAMRRQLALSQRIITVIAASKNAYEQGNGLDGKLTSLHASAPSGLPKTLQKQLADLTGTVKDASMGLSGGSYAVPPVKGTTSFSRINGQAAALLEMVESTSDHAPVPSLYRTYADLCRDFNATLTAWHSLQGKVAELDADSEHTDRERDIISQPVVPLACATALGAQAP